MWNEWLLYTREYQHRLCVSLIRSLIRCFGASVQWKHQIHHQHQHYKHRTYMLVCHSASHFTLIYDKQTSQHCFLLHRTSGHYTVYYLVVAQSETETGEKVAKKPYTYSWNSRYARPIYSHVDWMQCFCSRLVPCSPCGISSQHNISKIEIYNPTCTQT